MPITFDCACGKSLRVPDEHAGRRVKCPACSVISIVPAPEPQFEVVEDTSVPLVSPPPRARPVAKPATSQTDDDDDDDDRAYGVAKSNRHDDDDEEEERPRKKKKKKRRPPPQDDSGGSSGGGGGVAGGALMMLIAVVWFVLGLVNDWVFFYPPILFILGLIAFFKGLAGEE